VAFLDELAAKYELTKVPFEKMRVGNMTPPARK
jgi:hypothetical protein